jgi:hypothetical protein
MRKFQKQIDILAEGDYFRFSLVVWDIGGSPWNICDEVRVFSGDSFPYLDLEMFWASNQFQFRVHLKPNQKLKYLNHGSTHTSATFRAIPRGVFSRLGRLTSLTSDNHDMALNELYPHHAKALEVAGLAPKQFPGWVPL